MAERVGSLFFIAINLLYVTVLISLCQLEDDLMSSEMTHVVVK